MRVTTLETICRQISSGGTPSRKKAEFFTADTEGHLWVKSKELLDGSINDTEERITDEGLQNSSAKYYPENTVLIAMYGANVGQLAWLKRPATVNQAVCGLVIDDSKADWKFVFYSLLQTRGDLTVQAQGAAQQNLNQDLIRQFEISLPPLPEQKCIAGILSAYDELIENSQRRIKVLETMARNLYREWFVHYRYPGHENTPLIPSPLGDIPKGWEVKKLGELAGYLNRGISPRYDENGTSTVINQKCIRDQRLSLEPSRLQVKPIPSEKLVRFGDVLINSTGVGTLGRVAQVYESLENCTVDTHVTIARVNGDADVDFFGCALLAQQDAFERLGIGATGQTELSRTAIGNVDLVVPLISLQNEFGKIVQPIREKAVVLGKQIQNLRKTRDLLLPQLLSGQIPLHTPTTQAA